MNHSVAQNYTQLCFVFFFFEGAQHDDAVSCFSRLLDLAPGSGLGHLGLGTKALQEGRYKDAVEKLKQGESVDRQRWILPFISKAPEYYTETLT